jgi:hypothetical protein
MVFTGSCSSTILSPSLSLAGRGGLLRCFLCRLRGFCFGFFSVDQAAAFSDARFFAHLST